MPQSEPDPKMNSFLYPTKRRPTGLGYWVDRSALTSIVQRLNRERADLAREAKGENPNPIQARMFREAIESLDMAILKIHAILE